jgi:YbbR domain-containing protein
MNTLEQQIEVRLTGPSSILSNFKPWDISMPLDLSNGKPGRQAVKFNLDAVKVPAGLKIQKVSPNTVEVVLAKIERRNIPVSVKIKEWDFMRNHIRGIEIEPSEVEVEAPPEEFFRIPAVYTQEIEVEPGMDDIFTTVTRVELKEAHARITSNPNIRVKIHFNQNR